MDCFLERHKQGEIERLKSPKFIEEIELIIKNSPKKKKKSKKKTPGPDHWQIIPNIFWKQ